MKAIFFDAHGVLYRRASRAHPLIPFLQGHQLACPPPKALRQLRKEVRRLSPYSTQTEQNRAILAALGITEPTLIQEGLQVLAQAAAEIVLFPGVIETLQALQGRGFQLGVITNSNAPSAEKQRWFTRCGLDVRWDAFIASCEVKMAKPQPAIYRLALETCAVQPHEALFVGHEAAELQGARAVGMRTVAFACETMACDSVTHFSELLDLPYLCGPL
jgi:HAD superfamily hydrolase (TIGR01509 family)